MRFATAWATAKVLLVAAVDVRPLRRRRGQRSASSVIPMVQINDDPYVRHSLLTSTFFPKTRLLVLGNPKAAGTTLRWWLLAAHGVDVRARTAKSLWGESAPFQTVWDPAIDLEFTWGCLSLQQQQDALTSTDVLTVHPVRHPLSRLFSAWSSKYLVGEPYYSERLPDGFPTVPDTVEDENHVAELFEKFVDALHDTVSEGDFLALDVHFWPQARLLARPMEGDELVVRQEHMAEGLAAIASYLAERDLEAGEAPRINETVVPYRDELVSDRTKDMAIALYGEDFERWQYPRDLPPSSSRPVDIEWLNDVRGRNRRYGVLHREVLRAHDENAHLRAEEERLSRRERELLNSTSWKVTRPLRWVSNNAKR